MMVLASSILRAKQSVGTPTPFEIAVIGPTEAQSGKGAIRQIVEKSPNPPMLAMMVNEGRKRCDVDQGVVDALERKFDWCSC